MTSTSSTGLPNSPPDVLPPSFVHAASADEAHRAVQNIEERERKLRNPFLHLFSKKTAKSKRTTSSRVTSVEPPLDEQDDNLVTDLPGQAATSTGYNETTIVLKDASTHNSKRKDNYRWAIVYENERGITLFSIPLYSRCPLFPTDPLNHTLPSTGKLVTREHQPFITLDEYPLPNSSWRWVSNDWMIDMRGAASVQQDGFEYNWRFRRSGWRYRSGFMGAGSWVRRRRWMRLMVRHEFAPPEVTSSNTSAVQATFMDELNRVWQGDVFDWHRLRKAMRALEIDGMKLEVWRMWLGCSQEEQRWPSAEYDSVTPSLRTRYMREPSMDLVHIGKADKQHIATILSEHGVDILSSFIYSECRTEFLRMLIETGHANELSSTMPRSHVDFWRQLRSLEEYIREQNSSSGFDPVEV